jgi:hypothetical protein
MRDQLAPFLLGFLLSVTVIENGSSEGAGDGEEYEPIAGRKL